MRFEKGHGESPKMEELAKGDVLFVRSLGYDATVIRGFASTRPPKGQGRNMELEVPVSDTAGRRTGLFQTRQRPSHLTHRMRKSQLKSDSLGYGSRSPLRAWNRSSTTRRLLDSMRSPLSME